LNSSVTEYRDVFFKRLWHIVDMARFILFSVVLGCANTRVSPCQEWKTHQSDAWPVITVGNDSQDDPITLQLSIPSKARFGDGTPAVVYVHGGWRTDMLPVAEEESVLLSRTLGFVTIYLNLPGGDETLSTPGIDDLRGPVARAAVGTALRYAAGELRDSEDCTLDDRVPQGLSGIRAIAGMSNGGNLAWATAADPSLDLPTIHGIATFETPPSSQFILMEPGREPGDNTFFDERTCALDEHHQISCDHGYDVLIFNPNGSQETDGVLYIDTDLSGERSDPDITLGVAWDRTLGAWAQATPARAAAEAQGVVLSERLDLNTTRSFWVDREAPPNMAAAVARFPDIGGIATGTENDHVLGGLNQAVHLSGMVAAMQSAGVQWARLHPDASYVQAVSGTQRDFLDIDATTAIAVVDERYGGERDEDIRIQSADYFDAAIIELLDRARLNRWDPNLNEILVPSP
jgi:hypothetical protein